MSMIIGRKQIILAALIVALGAAIYLNYRYSAGDSVTANATVSSSGTIGDVDYVDNQSVSATTDVFASAQLSREQTRDEAKEVLESIAANSAVTSSEKSQALADIEALSTNIVNEGNIETLVKAKGFQNCVTIINNGEVTVIVQAKSDSFSESDLAQIKDIVISQTKVSSSKITIVQYTSATAAASKTASSKSSGSSAASKTASAASTAED